jgi:hypothetical protein
MFLTLLRFTLTLALLCASSIALADIVKLSRSNICHDGSSPSYLQTKHFTAYHSLAACFDAGGRLPKNGKKKTAHLSWAHYNTTANYLGTGLMMIKIALIPAMNC